MKNVKKKGFTIVELVIVVAVIAILAAVLIPTFSNVVSKANLSADQQNIKNMNTVLAVEEITDDVKSINKAREILMKYGFSTNDLIAKSKDHTIYWDSKENIVVLVNEITKMIIYPEVMTFDNTSNRYMNLSIILPNASLMDLGQYQILIDLQSFAGNTFEGGTKGSIELDKAIKLSVDEDNMGDEEVLSWHADFTITFNKSFVANIEDGGLSDGEVGFILAGSYDAYSDGEWIPLVILEAEANKPIRILQEVLAPMLGENGNEVFLSYEMITAFIPDFSCGIKAVYDNKLLKDDFNMNDQEYDEADKNLLNDLEVTIELRLYEIDEDDHETGKSHIIETIVQKYNIE